MMINFERLINSTKEEEFLQIFQDAFAQHHQPFLESHRTILSACYSRPK
jgi:hypothetical protein